MLICGIDEAGRGPLAGPVFAAAVILPEVFDLPGLGDSKKLSEKKRDGLFGLIRERAVAYCVASASVAEIEELNILGATMLAMRRAVAGLNPAPGKALIDGNTARGFDIPVECVVKGDEKIPCISAASILAKVSRDRYMNELALKYPQYGFERHKGYGTALHRQKIREHGATPEHRPLFLRKL